jgi:nitrate reductase molybdenum cofactor assembly chaperone NarJ/NarW
MMKLTLRVIARLFGYPEAELRAHIAELRDALHAERALPSRRLEEIDLLLDRLVAVPPLRAEAEYVETFDRGRNASLHLFEHVHGDSRDRGRAMVELMQTYEAAGLAMQPGELPDYLPALLEYASTQPPAMARALLKEVAHILRALFTALGQRESLYAALAGALLDLAGEKAERVKLPEEPALDAAWEEPAAFGGCSTAGQQRGPQPVHIVRRNVRETGAHA